MEKDIKLALGRILGEVYRLQLKVDPETTTTSKAVIYGLMNGIEEVVNEQICDLEEITLEDVRKVRRILQPIFDEPSNRDPETLEFRKISYDEIKMPSDHVGLDEATLMSVLKYLFLNNQYRSVIKMIEYFDVNVE